MTDSCWLKMNCAGYWLLPMANDWKMLVNKWLIINVAGGQYVVNLWLAVADNGELMVRYGNDG